MLQGVTQFLHRLRGERVVDLGTVDGQFRDCTAFQVQAVKEDIGIAAVDGGPGGGHGRENSPATGLLQPVRAHGARKPGLSLGAHSGWQNHSGIRFAFHGRGALRVAFIHLGSGMSKGIYAAASAMVAETRALEVAARNVAHGTTTGYRREQSLRSGFAESLMKAGGVAPAQQGIAKQGGAGVHPNGSWFNFSQGEIEDTGGTFDLAISGDGFFRVRSPDGALHLTRAGRFTPDENGRLVTPDGWTVEGQGGPITVPADAERVVIDEQGRITVATTAEGVVTENVIDQLRLSTVDKPQDMTAKNGVFFDAGNQELRDATGRLHQGRLEKGNAEPVRELVDLIALQRRYDAAQKAMSEQSRAGEGFSDLLRT